MSIKQETDEYIKTCRRDLPSSIDRKNVVFGFDGVIDRVRTVVGTRTGPDQYQPMRSLEEFGTRIVDSAAIDTSCSIEWITDGMRAGGHTAHLGRAMERLGFTPTLIGTFGTPPEAIFENEYKRATLISVGPAPTTDAIEFSDGKVLLSETSGLANMNWEEIRSTVGLEPLTTHFDRAELVGMGYWSTLPQLPTIWDGIREEVWPKLQTPPERILFDPGDVRRLSRNTLDEGLSSLRSLDDMVPVTVSANTAETIQLAELFDDTTSESLADAASLACDGLSVSEFVAHASTEAVLVNANGIHRIEIPAVTDPALTTSAGDHFNAGLITARLVGINGGAQLVVGSAVAGWFVRNARPPTLDELHDFLASDMLLKDD